MRGCCTNDSMLHICCRYASVHDESLSALVDLLLGLALVMSGVAWKNKSQRRIAFAGTQRKLTSSFLRTIASDSTDDGILLASDAVGGALNIALGLGSLVLSLARGVLLLAGLGP